jgi:hypothetical protein
MGQALLLVLVDRTGRGAHAADAGRAHYGAELARANGRERPYSTRTVSRYLAELTAAAMIRTRRRWDPGFAEHLPAFRYLGDKLLEGIGELARQRSRGRRRGRSEPEQDTRPQPGLVAGTSVVRGCAVCHVQAPDHLPGCPHGPPGS